MLGELLGAGASLLGGLLGKSSADKNAARNVKMQKEFAQNGIQWKVEDAKKAGISPIYALGAQTQSFSPISVGDPLSSGVAAAGQDIGRAINATETNTGRTTAFSQAVQALQIDGMKLDNDIKRQELLSKIATRNATGVPPAMPGLENTFIAGQGNAEDPFKVQKQLNASEPGKPESEAGLSPELSWYKTKDGYVPQIPQNLGDAMEAEPLNLSGGQWFLRNKVLPMFSPSAFNPPFKADSMHYWTFDPIFGQYKLHERAVPRRHFMYPDRMFNDGRG